MGTFMDLGGRAEFNIFNSVKNTYFTDTQKHIDKIHRIPFIEPISGYVVMRVGHNFLSLIATYRFTDLFKPVYEFPELPRYSIGLEINNFK